jgi:hypothetical protein
MPPRRLCSAQVSLFNGVGLGVDAVPGNTKNRRTPGALAGSRASGPWGAGCYFAVAIIMGMPLHIISIGIPVVIMEFIAYSTPSSSPSDRLPWASSGIFEGCLTWPLLSECEREPSAGGCTALSQEDRAPPSGSAVAFQPHINNAQSVLREQLSWLCRK